MKNKYKFLVSLVAVFTTFSYCLNLSMLDVMILDDVRGEAHAEGISYPYTKYFSISAYYSPLPGQSWYVTGSYSSDIRLNGRGTNGADGTPVYPGMIAAPKVYSFGTKLYIPGIGMTAVHDRGGAIVQAAEDWESGPKYDRLDIWMGYGDKGLKRALDWGLRTVEVTVYGIDNSIVEDVDIPGYSSDEKTDQEYFYIPEYYEDYDTGYSVESALFPEDLWYLSESDEVKKLQEYLRDLGYFDGVVNGYFGDDTRMAIYVFQKANGLVQNIADLGAGHFGPATRKAFEEAALSRKEQLVPQSNLGPESNSEDSIKKLQQVLKLMGYKVAENGVYDEETQDAVFKFQIDNNILNNVTDYGAGYFGPRTLSVFSSKLSDLLEEGKIEMPVAHASSEIEELIESRQVLSPPLHADLAFGDSGPDVKRLQQELRNLSLLRIEPTGNYGEITEHAVFKFQQINGLVTDKSSELAGVFGSQTRDELNQIIAEKNYYSKKISEKRK